jgi:hypothetical protein
MKRGCASCENIFYICNVRKLRTLRKTEQENNCYTSS